ncbi:MAG: tetratricopeptide repeat protein [Candidatus Omnitrophica bacterium]|nr:tetratricopeptide repeat protein [Candidatus Omnitrophota bacterium]
MAVKWMEYVKVIVTRPIFLYLICFGGVALMVDYPLFKKNFLDQTMNRLSPPINYFKDFANPKDYLSDFKLRQCIYYHQKVVDFYDFERPAAYAMMGYCYEHLGESQKALKAYQSALDINPNDFWSYYNMGVISYQRGSYQKAADYFKEALLKDVNLNVYVLYKSKMYTDIRVSNGSHSDYDYFQGLRQGHVNSYIYLMESLAKAEDYERLPELAVVAIKENLGEDDIFYYYAGRAEFSQKSYDKAVEFLRLSIEKNPNNFEAYLYLGLTMRAVGKEDIALKLLKTSENIRQMRGSYIEHRLSSGVRFF